MPAGPQVAEEVTRASGNSGSPTGWRRYVYSTNHKDIGMMYLVFAIAAGLIGAFLSVMMRVELAAPGIQIFEHQNTFHAFVTGHGLIMVFFVVLPALIGGFGNWFVPLMIGAGDMAFPRLNNLSFWLLPGALTLMILSLFVEGESGGMGAGGGWTLYPPLSNYGAPGPAMDFAIFSLYLAGVSSMIGAINFIATIFNMRAPGMSLHEMPHFVWALLVTAFLLVVTLPVFVAAITMVLTDRNFGTTFFNPAGGGDRLLYGQLIGFFGLPQLYILILPGFGIVSQIVSTFSRKPVFGYLAMATAMVAIGVLGLIVWVGQMTTAAIGLEPSAFFLATVAVAAPAGVMVISCLATMWGGSIEFRTPMLWAIGFLSLMTIGGAAGVAFAGSGFEWVPHDTYDVVAHFHTVLAIGAIFAIFAGWYYWFPKISDSMYNENLANTHFWLTLVGVNLTFFPMHFLGLGGMPRRAADYADAYAGWNGVASAGAMISTAGLVVFFVCLAEALMRRRPAGKYPWGAGATTLEWRLPSPPPFQTDTRLPRIAGSSAR